MLLISLMLETSRPIRLGRNDDNLMSTIGMGPSTRTALLLAICCYQFMRSVSSNSQIVEKVPTLVNWLFLVFDFPLVAIF